MIKIRHRGDFKNTEGFLNKAKDLQVVRVLERYGREGVDALSRNTPIDSGATASSWGYEIRKNRGRYSIVWTNSNIINGIPIAILIQYGHGTRNGGYVRGRDFINPAVRPIFDKIAEEVWREVTSL